jgi:hypothetical protein
VAQFQNPPAPKTGCKLPLENLASIPAAYRQTARRVRNKYRELYEVPVAAHGDGSRAFHRGWMRRVHGLNVLVLRGDGVEMAFQHGRLLADQIPHGAVPQSAKLAGDSIANVLWTRGKLEDRLFYNAERLLIRRLFARARRQLAAAFGENQSLEEMIALGDSSGLAVNDVIQGLYNPELLLILAKYQGSRHAADAPFESALVPPTCCSSFAARGTIPGDGELLIGRNLDYPLNGFFDRFPTVIYFEPPEPALRYMTFTSAGVHTAGVTGYNEAGIFLASHVAPSTNVSLGGVPAMMTADNIIRRATSFDQAVEHFRNVPPLAGWSYLVASMREGKIASLEMTPSSFAVRPIEGDWHVQTNHFLTPALRSFNLFLNRSVDEDSLARALRMMERLRESVGRLDANAATSILADQIDPEVGAVRGLGNTVGCHTTLGSVVLDPARGRALVSSGQAPACHSEFVELPLAGTFARDETPMLDGGAVAKSSFDSDHPEKLTALKLFIEAKIAYETRNDHARPYELMKQVVWHDPSNPAYFFQLAIFALKNRQYDEALDALEGVFHSPYVTAQLRRLAHYYLGRTFAHLKQKRVALSHFQAVLDDPRTDAKLRKAANQAIRRTGLFGRCPLRKRSLVLMMQHSDMLYY